MKIGQKAPRITGRSARGFTIIEIVVSLLIFGFLVLAVYGAITSGMNNVRMARENLRATQILLEKVEALRLYNWEQLNASFVAPTFIVPYDSTAGTNGGVLYYGKLTINPANSGTSYSNDLKVVTVQLDWKTGSLPRHRQISTYVCRTGIQNYIY